MVRNRRLLGIGAAVLLAWGGLSAAPAQAADDGYTSLTAHGSAADPAEDTTDSWSGGAVHLYDYTSGISVITDTVDGHQAGVSLAAPAGQTMTVGTTYRTETWPDEPTAKAGRLTAYRDGSMCGQDVADPSNDPYYGSSWATGSFTVQELERGADGAITRFRATYELGCQTLGGQHGTEGSIAVNATAPAEPVPTTTSPGPVTGLRAANVGPDGSGDNTTTLSWTNPVGASDVVIDMVQSSNVAKMPEKVGGSSTKQFSGSASRYHDDHVEFMDTRTYRVTPRTAGGRLGEPALITVYGTRITLPSGAERIQVGESASFTGRLSQSWDYVDFHDVMKGPGIEGQRVQLCRQSSTHFVYGSCDLVATTTTTTNGAFTFSVRPVQNSYYNVRVPAGPTLVGNVAWVVSTAYVAPQTDLSAPASQVAEARTGVVRRGSVIRFSTSRARTGSNGIARLQRLDGRTWRTLVTKRIATSGPRRMGIPYRERTAGTHQYRVTKSPDSRHVTGYSKVVRIRVG